MIHVKNVDVFCFILNISIFSKMLYFYCQERYQFVNYFCYSDYNFCNIDALGKNIRSKCKIFKYLGATT